MALQITKGIQKAATRAVIYGVEGIGKSTLASHLDDVLFLDTEDGTKQIDVARVACPDWRAAEGAVKELIKDHQGFKTVAIDTADWLEKLLIENMLRLSGKKSIEDYGFGKGYTMLQEHMVRFLNDCDLLVSKGVNVVFIAHSKVQRVSPPDESDGYDRYELKMSKQVAPLFKEWADLLLFLNFKIQLVEGNDGKMKAQGGKERVMYAERSAAWDAKNRYGLPAEMPMDVGQIAHIFSGAQPRPVAKAAPVKAEAPKETPKPEAPKEEPKVPQAPVGDFDSAEDAEEIAKVAELIKGNEEKAIAFLVSISWLKKGETLNEISPENRKYILQNSEKFLKTAKIK